jgi:acetylornithine deacetylase/succinyl-diaminopimelate desuccinylase-like protein
LGKHHHFITLQSQEEEKLTTLPELLRAVEAAEKEIIALEQALVRFPTVNTGSMPTGNETPLAEFLARKLGEEQIDAEVIESAPGRGNLVASLPGTANGPRLLFMAHTDVVPVEDESAWRFPPFEAKLSEGRVWGRGASDCKALVVCETMATILLKRAGVSFRGDLVLTAGADEETGGDYGYGWLARNMPSAVRADFAINEGGGLPLTTDRGLLFLLSHGEKGRLEIKITLRGKSFHAASPWRAVNPYFALAEALNCIEKYEPELDVSSPIFRHLGLFGIEEEITVDNVNAIANRLSAEQNETLSAKIRGLSRMTLTPTLVSGGVKSNQIPNRCHLVCDVRTLPHQGEAYVREEVAKALRDVEGVEDIQVKYTAVPSTSEYETSFAEQVKRATQAALDRRDLLWVPCITTGFTDSRLVRPLGTIVYNFSPSHPDSDPDLVGAHCVDESVDIASLVTRTKMLVALAWNVLR